MGSIEIKEGFLPAEPVENALTCPSFQRFESCLPAAVGTVDSAVKAAGLQRESVLIIADSSPELDPQRYLAGLNKHFKGRPPASNIYILHEEAQRAVVRELADSTGLREALIAQVLRDPSCGGNREKISAITEGYLHGTSNGAHIRLAFFDDDIEIPETVQWASSAGGGSNSQVIVDESRQSITLERKPNGSIKDFLDIPGLALKDAIERHVGFTATETWIDTMHQQLTIAQRDGYAVFQVNPDSDAAALTGGTIWGVSAIKHLRPDYRTVEVARDFLENEFPEQELPIMSYPCGGSDQLFAFEHCVESNVDAAFSAWHMNDKTARLPFSYLANPEISRSNPYLTVTSRTRADNELLPEMTKHIRDATGERLLYAAGSDFHVEHYRTPSGYRPVILEQACTSLIDSMYARLANQMMQYDSSLSPSLRSQDIDNTNVPDKWGRSVFRQLCGLAEICERKADELGRRGGEEQKIEQYRAIYDRIKFKLGVRHAEVLTGKDGIHRDNWESVAYDSWKEQIDTVGRKLLDYFRETIEARRRIVPELQEILRSGKYPALLIPAQDPSDANQPSIAAAEKAVRMTEEPENQIPTGEL